MIDIFPYGYKQFKDMIEDVNPFVFDILEGVVVFTGDERKLKDIVETMERVITERGVKRTEYGVEYAV